MKPPSSRPPGGGRTGGPGPGRPDGGRPGGPRHPKPHHGKPHHAKSHHAGPPGSARRWPGGDRPPGDAPRRDQPQAAAPGRPQFAPRPSDRPELTLRQGPDSPRGAVWLYGVHAVAAALGNPARRLRRLLVTEEAEAALSARIALPWPLAPERTERARLDQLLGRGVVHQGIALLADPLAPPPLAQLLDRPGPLVVLDQVADPRNVGAILRCAAAFAAAGVITQDRHAPEESGALAKAASGALEVVPLVRAVNIARTLLALKSAGCWVVGLEAAAPPLSGPALAQRRIAVVLGAEGEGLRRLTRDTCDELAGIAMPGGGGGLDSLNVAATTAIALYELGRRA